MKLVCGLGNPGEKYSITRHNVGFILLDKFLTSTGYVFQEDAKLKGYISRIKLKNAFTLKEMEILLLKPQTFMNLSGESVARTVNFYKILPQDLLVVHDDVDLPFGSVKKQYGASSAGHRGIQHIIETLGTKDFWRLRVGIGRPDNASSIRTEDWVLMNFSAEELTKITSIDLAGYF